MASANDWKKNCDKAEKLVRDAAQQGANLVLLQELFDGDYFCIEQHGAFRRQRMNSTVTRPLRALPHLPRNWASSCRSAFSSAPAMPITTPWSWPMPTGSQLGIYRKSHIPDGRGYQEKFYFSPGDTGFKVWDTAAGRIGLGICWDQWFPECARAMALQGAELLLYPTAIGSEPPNPDYDSSTHWQNAMRGHAAANIMPLAASNRVGKETAPDGRWDHFLWPLLHFRLAGRKARRDGPQRRRRSTAEFRSRCDRRIAPHLGCVPRPAPGTLRRADDHRRPHAPHRQARASAATMAW